MRIALAVFVLVALAGCDAFGSDDGSFDLRATGDVEFSQTGTARLRESDGRTVLSLVRDDGPVALQIEGPDRAFAVGTAGVSRSSALDVRIPMTLADDRLGVTGTVTFTSVSSNEVAGSFDVGLATFGDTPLRTVRGTFRAVR